MNVNNDIKEIKSYLETNENEHTATWYQTILHSIVPVAVLEIWRGTLWKVYDCISTKLYTWNQYKIKSNKKRGGGRVPDN